MSRRLFLSLLPLVFFPTAHAQLVEEFVESIEDVVGSSEFMDQLDDLRKDPVDLNLASVDDLLRLPWVTPLMAKEIVYYRDTRGPIEHLSELESLIGFDPGLIKRMNEFVVVRLPKKMERRTAIDGRSRFKLPQRSEADYLGSRTKFYTRMGVSINKRHSAGFLIEKDAYEQNYADFASYFAQLGKMGVLKKLVIGHYYLEFGEGLIFSPADFSIKSQGTVKKGNRGILIARSSDENRSLLGSALAIGSEKLDVSAFVSIRSLDATLNPDGSVKSLYESGLHRTENEVEKKDVLTERLLGTRITFTPGDVGGGLTYCRSEYSRSFESEDFSGSAHSLMGFDLEGRVDKFRFFGEAAFSRLGGSGALLSTRFSTRRHSTGLLLRTYSHDFWSPHAAGFSEYGTRNEQGVYGFTRFSTEKGTRIEAYLDLFRNTMPEEAGEFRRTGSELQVSLNQRISRPLRLQMRYRRKLKSDDLRESLRFQLDADGPGLSVRIRTEFSNARAIQGDEKGRGHLEFVRLRYEPFSAVQLEGRIVLFSTESYDARIYAYERDLPGYFRNVALYGEGTRLHLLIHCRPLPWFDITAKYAWQKREDIEEEFGLQFDLLSFL